MQQLTLFNSHAGGAARTGKNRHMRKTTRTTPVPHQKWDLWTQETEAEREMALFFLDIRNFTSLAEKHQAVDVIHIVKKIFATHS